MYNVKHAVVFANDKFMDRRYIIVLFSGKRKLFQNFQTGKSEKVPVA